MPSKPTQRMAGQRGYSLIEVLTAVAIFGVLAAAGLPHLDTRRQDIQTVTKQVIGDYRWARNRAITSGAHFAVEWMNDQTYQIVRMKQDNNGDWAADQIVKTVSLPSQISTMWWWPDTHEFNTRGMMISSTWPLFQLLWDDQYTAYHVVSLWPSGQIYEEY